MKTILTLICLFILFGCNAQNANTVTDRFQTSIKVKDVCFNGVCLFDSLSSALKVFGKPNEIITEKIIEPVDGREYIFIHYRYYSGNDENKYFQFSENIVGKKGIIIDFKNVQHPAYIFGKEKQFYINQDTIELKNIAPMKYYKARQWVEGYIKERTKDILQKFEKIKQFKEFETDSTFRKSKTNEFNQKIKEIEKNRCCLSISLGIENNNYGYNGVVLQYVNRKLSFIWISKEL
ncbi:hypothetical protein [Emticicia sp. SJ17W-69]|uniref:hypothetical protein n=1 Tax=Emticicia sp. SJ17W-69 TaxID=3421657 RepID=UPI003EBE6BEE